MDATTDLIRPEPKTNKGWANLKPATKGEVRNPRGRPKKDLNLADMAQRHAEKAIETLATCLTDSTATWSARVSAASELLDRGFGRAPQSLDVKHEIGFTEQFETYLRDMMGAPRTKVIEHAELDSTE